mmetsp:Transcript_24685/g.71062  ORF Transcript_24685/g.71062 Transcript_24685/m.71062 type:complete len:117 (-) Transcript_24685:94-444(-)
MALALRSRSSLPRMALICAAAAALWLACAPQASTFAGGAQLGRGQLGLSSSRTAVRALPQAEISEASTLVLADSTDAIPLVAFLVSVFVGIVGYSVWTAFGPGSDDLRDPFEEHED